MAVSTSVIDDNTRSASRPRNLRILSPKSRKAIECRQ